MDERMQRDKAAAAEKAAIMKVDNAYETRQQGERKDKSSLQTDKSGQGSKGSEGSEHTQRHKPEKQGRRKGAVVKKDMGRRQGSRGSAGSDRRQRSRREAREGQGKNSRSNHHSVRHGRGTPPKKAQK